MYEERKAIETAATFLRKWPERMMDYYDLVTLVYFADRHQVLTRGRTITGDDHESLPWGLAGRHLLDSIRRSTSPRWNAHIVTDHVNERCALVTDAPPAALSRADLASIEAVWSEFGDTDGVTLMRHALRLPEFAGSDERVPVSLEAIARAVGHPEDEVARILAYAEEIRETREFMDQLARPRIHA